MDTNIPKREQGEEFEHAEELKEKMPEFIDWRNQQIKQLSDDKRDRAEQIAKDSRQEGFWMNEGTILNLHVIHGLSLDKIEQDIQDAIDAAFDDEED